MDVINSTSTSGHIAYGIKEFVLDTPEDLKELPIECKMGSTAFVISTSQSYMINSSGEWVELK